MPDMNHHEKLSRGPAVLDAINSHSIMVCGAGALGSNLVDTLSRQGVVNISVIDDDRVEQHNIGTQVYGQMDIGKLKAIALRDRVYDATGNEIKAISKRLEQATFKLAKSATLVIDCFDNAQSRQAIREACRNYNIPLLHAGLSDNYGEVIWDKIYKIPRDAEGDVCDYPLSRNIITMTVTVTSEAIYSFVMDKLERNFSITLKDLKITEF